ncbi:hypothetical protein FB446DRAFT_708309 [Lentinula raphanica]|nr:hypothetical protein FB446DRAFT_708309 [Lentinula raphanica]
MYPMDQANEKRAGDDTKTTTRNRTNPPFGRPRLWEGWEGQRNIIKATSFSLHSPVRSAQLSSLPFVFVPARLRSDSWTPEGAEEGPMTWSYRSIKHVDICDLRGKGLGKKEDLEREETASLDIQDENECIHAELSAGCAAIKVHESPADHQPTRVAMDDNELKGTQVNAGAVPPGTDTSINDSAHQFARLLLNWKMWMVGYFKDIYLIFGDYGANWYLVGYSDSV